MGCAPQNILFLKLFICKLSYRPSIALLALFSDVPVSEPLMMVILSPTICDMPFFNDGCGGSLVAHMLFFP
eukprot:1161394-Pelagomonas_calceolata.AAC.9